MTFRVSRSLDLPAQPEEVWAELLNWDEMDEWFCLVRRVERLEPSGELMRRRLRTYVGMEFVETIDRADAPHTLSWFVENPSHALRSSRARADLRGNERGGTSLTWTVDIEGPRWLETVIGRPVVKPLFGRVLARSLQNLRARFASGPRAKTRPDVG